MTQNVAIFLTGLASLNVGLWLLHPAAPFVTTGLILISLVFVASSLPQPPKEPKR